MKNAFCKTPFTTLNINPIAFTTCCYGYLKDSVKISLCSASNNFWEVWNSVEFQNLRQAVLDGDYSYCPTCPRVHFNRIGTNQWDMDRSQCKPIMELPPLILSISSDNTCNLSCLSCRQKFNRTKTQSEIDENFERLEMILDSCLGHVKVIHIGGMGEVFFSPVYLRLLENIESRLPIPNLNSIRIMSNGQLLHKQWHKWPKLIKYIDDLVISIDASSREIYEKVRKGASWDALIRSLEFIRDVVKPSKRELRFRSFYTVYSENFRDMPNFVRLMKEYACDAVVFSELRRFGQKEIDFYERQVTNPAHPNHQEYLNVLSDPILHEEPIVHLDLAVDLCQQINNHKSRLTRHTRRDG